MKVNGKELNFDRLQLLFKLTGTNEEFSEGVFVLNYINRLWELLRDNPKIKVARLKNGWRVYELIETKESCNHYYKTKTITTIKDKKPRSNPPEYLTLAQQLEEMVLKCHEAGLIGGSHV